MTLDEAIAHCLDVAVNGCGECAEEHAKLGLWLTELKDRREMERMEPLGRDSLGRLVYPGDVLTDGTIIIGYDPSRALLKGRLRKWFTMQVLAGVEVDLAASPRMTNFQRYFADLGTMYTVIEGWEDCSDLECGRCPFYEWGANFDVCPRFSDYFSGCIGFTEWLHEEATL